MQYMISRNWGLLTSSAGPQSTCSAEAALQQEPAVVGSDHFHCKTERWQGTLAVAARTNENSTTLCDNTQFEARNLCSDK